MFRRFDLFDEMFDMLRDLSLDLHGRRLLPAGAALPAPAPDRRSTFRPAVECFTRDRDLVVRAELPGVEPGDVEVSVTGGQLVIRGQKRQQHQTEEGNVFYREVSHGQFERSFTLPEGVMTDQVKATYTNGVLEITIPAELPAARKVPVQIGEDTTGKKAIKAA